MHHTSVSGKIICLLSIFALLESYLSACVLGLIPVKRLRVLAGESVFVMINKGLNVLDKYS